MLRVFTERDAARAVAREAEAVVLQLPGDLMGSREASLVRGRVWQFAVRRYRGRNVSTVPVARWGADTLFLVRRCAPPVRRSASLKAEVFLACTVGGLSRSQAAAKFGIPRSSVTDIVLRMKRG